MNRAGRCRARAFRRLHLDARRGLLVESPVEEEGSVAYVASRGRASFVFRFDRDTEVTGGMRLRLWIAPEETDDADLFVGIEKLSPTGTDTTHVFLG